MAFIKVINAKTNEGLLINSDKIVLISKISESSPSGSMICLDQKTNMSVSIHVKEELEDLFQYLSYKPKPACN